MYLLETIFWVLVIIVGGIIAISFIIVFVHGYIIDGWLRDERFAYKPKKKTKKSSSNPTREQLNRYYRTGNRRFLYDKDFRG